MSRVGWGAIVVQVSLSKTVGVFSLLLVLAGCTTTTSPPASEAERKQAMLAYLACLDKYVPKLDDRISDARVIAVALVRGPCGPESDTALEAYARGLSPLARKKFYDNPYATYEVAMEAVLRHRAGR